MDFGDLGNGLFECLGGLVLWQNVRRILQDKKLAGVDWRVTGFFTAWGFWNLWYYPHLHQTLSFIGGLNIVAANFVWLWFAIKYRNVK
ncbi:MAG TPA: hypothetical protein VNH18_34000 [Bryobacteraceae bacterium]|nr:hypothetical protein [Bryobacteraceae bacterium]